MSPKLFVFIATFFTGLWLLNSCEKEPTIIGSGILPPSDYISISSTDTFKITSYTNYDDIIRTDDIKNPFIGVRYDQNFGTTTSGFVTQLRLESAWWEDKESWKIDSVILCLRVISNVGTNDNFRHYLRISEISTMLYNNTPYYADKSVDTTGFGVSAYIPLLSDTTTIHNIEITLPHSFGERLIRDQNQLFYDVDPDKTDFRDYFKGIYITMPSASATHPFMLGFDFTYLADGSNPYQNYIMVYVKDSTNYWEGYMFLLDSRRENARFTKIEHDFSANLQSLIDKNHIDYTDTLSYVQGIYGAYTTITIPGLEAIKNDPNRARSAVNKARLTVPVYSINYTDTVAPRLLMRYVNKDGKKEIVPDYFIGTEQYVYDDNYYYDGAEPTTSYKSYFDGTFDATKHVYNFNLSRFVQNYFNDTQNILKPELEIFLPANEAANAIIKANDSKTPLKFELTLTDY